MSSNLSQFISKKSFRRCGLYLFTYENAKELINKIEEVQLPVLGIDAFELINEKIRPSLDSSIDLSYDEIEISWKKARACLDLSASKDFYYEIVF